MTAAITCITKIKRNYYYVTNERTSSPTIDREGLSNGKAAAILSLYGLTSTRARGQGQVPPLFVHIHLAERRQALRQREPRTQGCAPPTCVCSRLLFLHPTQAVFNGKDLKFVTTKAGQCERKVARASILLAHALSVRAARLL